MFLASSSNFSFITLLRCRDQQVFTFSRSSPPEEDAVQICVMGLRPGGQEIVSNSRQPFVIAQKICAGGYWSSLDVERSGGEAHFASPTGGICRRRCGGRMAMHEPIVRGHSSARIIEAKV